MQQVLQKKMDEDLVRRGRFSAASNVISSLFFFWFGLNALQYRTPILIVSIMAGGVAVGRLILLRWCRNEKLDFGRGVRLLKFTIVLSSALWALDFSLLYLEFGFESQIGTWVTFVNLAMTIAAAVSLCSSTAIQITYSLGNILPIFGVLVFRLHEQAFRYPLFYLAIFFLSYAFRQGLENRKHLKIKATTEISLEALNEQLRLSRQAMFEQTTKIVHASRMASIGEMAAGVAHEINNPLGVILLNQERLKRTFTDPNMIVDRQKIIRAIERIESGVMRIDRIVQSLQTFSREDDSKPKVELKFGDVIDSSLSLVREKIFFQGIELKVEGDYDLLVHGREFQIVQILLHIINNAFDGIVEAPSEKAFIKLLVNYDGDHLILRVSNSGARIPSVVSEKMFEPFFTTKDVGKGTGLGLTVSRNMAEEHGGRLEFDPKAEDTTFVLTLPAIRDPAKKPIEVTIRS